MKRFIFSLVCIILCINVINISVAKSMDETSIKLDFYKLSDNELMGDYQRSLVEYFNKRVKKSRASLVNNGGVEKVLIIPFEFRNVKFERDIKEYNVLLGDLKKYYELNSCYKKGERGITIEYKVLDKISGKYDMKHYAVNPFGEEKDQDIRMDEMAVEAVEFLKEKDFDFSEYDSDKDGIVDHVMIIHAGMGQEENYDKDSIWSHSYAIRNNGMKVGDVTVLNYITVPENAMLGVVVHEFGHDLGLPDLYDTCGNNDGIGMWDVMASGEWNYKRKQIYGECPCNLSCWSREFLRWGKIEEIDESKEIKFYNINGISNMYKVYLRDKYGRKNTNEYYLLEYRRRIGFDESLPGDGILIWHIDENCIQEKFFWNALNTDSYRMGISLVQADGKFHLTSKDDFNSGDAGDPFPGENPYNIFGAIPNKLNFDNNGNYSFVEGRNFRLDGDTATMYLDLDIKAPNKKIETYAPLNESKVGGKVVFCCDYVPKCSEYILQVSDNEDFLFPLQYNVNGDKYDIEIKKGKILFSENFDYILEREKEYYWRLAAVNPLTSNENLEWSNPKKMVYANGDAVEAPSNIKFDITRDDISISWPNEEGAYGYIVLCNEEEFYNETNSMKIKNTESEYRVRIRSISEVGASEFGDEVLTRGLKNPNIDVEVGKIENDLVLPEYITLEIKNGTFCKSGNYNECTVSIDELPIGMKQGDVLWLDEKTIRVNLDTRYSFVLNKDSKFTVRVSKNLINDFCGDDLYSEFVLRSNNNYHNDKLKFSFSGTDARKIVGIVKGMEYSIDGGVTYKKCKKDDMMLCNEEFENLNGEDGIIARTNDGKYYVINILENDRTPIIIADYDNNQLSGLTCDMEYSYDGVNWVNYEDDLEKIENKIWVRYKGHGRVKASDSVSFEFFRG